MTALTASSCPSLSLEFFPPRDIAARERLVRTAKQLRAVNPDYVSVTFGAGGSTRTGTVQTIDIMRNLGFDAAPHISCVGETRDDLTDLLDAYRARGVDRIVALRGDLPSGMGGDGGELRYARDLVAFIREHSGSHFHVKVAANPETHPQAESASRDLAYFVEKVRAGADSAITQYFFNADAYFDFVDRAQAQGVGIPIVPGIMPITNHTQLVRFSQMCGAEIPRWIRLRLTDFGDDKASIRAFGLDVVSALCQRLLDNGAPGLHFYTLNAADTVHALIQRLGWEMRHGVR